MTNQYEDFYKTAELDSEASEEFLDNLDDAAELFDIEPGDDIKIVGKGMVGIKCLATLAIC